MNFGRLIEYSGFQKWVHFLVERGFNAIWTVYARNLISLKLTACAQHVTICLTKGIGNFTSIKGVSSIYSNLRTQHFIEVECRAYSDPFMEVTRKKEHVQLRRPKFWSKSFLACMEKVLFFTITSHKEITL